MEDCHYRFGFDLERISDGGLEILKINDRHISGTEIVCPKPVRATVLPGALESCRSFYSDPLIKSAQDGADCGLSLLKIIQNEDLMVGNWVGDEPNSQMSFFCGSPPARARNPVIHDSEFIRKSSTPTFPVYLDGIKLPSATSCSSPSVSKPIVRIEGFDCCSSKPDQVVTAIAYKAC